MQGTVLDSPISDYQFSYFIYFTDTSFLSVHNKEEEKTTSYECFSTGGKQILQL